jgi:CBS domain-containing protein
MLVQDIMTTAVKTANPDTLVREVALIMCFQKISGMPVVDNDNNIVGMISEKDILWGMFPDLQDVMGGVGTVDFEQLERDYHDVQSQKVSRLMTTRIYTVEPGWPVLKAASMMFRHRIRRIPVAVGGKLIGIVSVGDVHKAIFQRDLAREPVVKAAPYLESSSG